MSDGVSLADLRRRVGRSQAEVAGVIGTTQSGVSRIERQGDIKMSTLVDYVEALGGKLNVSAVFATDVVDLALSATSPSDVAGGLRREYRVVWQDKESRALVHVGWLEHADGEFTFCYTDDARRHDRFAPFPSLPSVDEVYSSSELFPFFALRLINTADPDYSAALDSLGLSRDRATPAELLARAPSDSPHDTIQVVPEPTELPDGSLERTFLVSGVRHAHRLDPGRVERALSEIDRGSPLELIAEPGNPNDPRALQLGVHGVVVGWVPGYLIDEFHRYLDAGRSLSFVVERSNGPESPWHLRLLCHLRVAAM